MRKIISSKKSRTELVYKTLCEDGAKTVTLLKTGAKFANCGRIFET